MTGIGYQLGQTNLGNLTYSYDLAGRRTSLGGSLAAVNLPSVIDTTAYNADNQLTQWGTATPTYDADGNTLSDGTNTYVWNERNQLASMNLTSESFQYDPFGRRTAKTILGTTTNYLYDGANPVQELSGTTPTANMLTGGVDEYFTRTDSTGTANFLTDALGSTISLTNSSGSTIASYTYEPFGNTTATGSSTNTYQYTGRENDGTGVYFYRGRYYSPTLQRFVSEDPIGQRGGINGYAYAGNDPQIRIDPFGLDWQQNAVSFIVGAGNTLSFGLTNYINNATGANSVVNKCNGWYSGGQLAGGVLAYAVTAGISAELTSAQELTQLGLNTPQSVDEGVTVYRVFGGESQGLGNYWTTINPGDVTDYGLAAGLPDANSGQFIIEGTLTDTEGVFSNPAYANPQGLGGGLTQVYIPNPGSQITLTGVAGVNPPF